MTANQRVHLMAELWPAAARVIGCSAQDRDRRLEEISLALGRPVNSASDIKTNEDFDKVKARMLALSQPANVDAQLKQLDQSHKRLVYAIKGLAAPAYIVAIARGKFHTEDWESLNEHQLTQLRNTLAARMSAKKKKPLVTVPAEDEGDPF